MTTRALLLIAATAALTLAAPSQAQQAGDQPVMVGSDTVEYTADGVIFRGRAEIMQGDTRLRADSITGFTAEGRLTRAEAAGDVYFVTPEQTIRGDRAVYTLTDGVIVVTGQVILTQGRNVMSGSRLTYNTRTQAARMEGAPRGAAGSRVQGVFYPSGAGNAG